MSLLSAAAGRRYAKLLADIQHQYRVDFAMSRDDASAPVCGIKNFRVVAALANNLAAIPAKMLQEVLAFQAPPPAWARIRNGIVSLRAAFRSMARDFGRGNVSPSSMSHSAIVRKALRIIRCADFSVRP